MGEDTRHVAPLVSGTHDVPDAASPALGHGVRITPLDTAVARELATTDERLEQTTARLAAEKAFNDAVIEAAPGLFYAMDREGRLVRWNRALLTGLDMTPETIAGFSPLVHLSDEDRVHAEAAIAYVFEHGSGTVQVRLPLPSGEADYLMTGQRVDIAGAPYLVGFGIDVTDRARAEEEARLTRAELEHRVTERTEALSTMNERLKRTERALLTLSWSNQSLARAQDADRLLQDVCDAALNIGGYRMAWVGFKQDDEAHTVRPVAWAGAEPEFFDALDVRWDGSPEGMGVVGRCIRQMRPVQIADIDNDPVFDPWRAMCAGRGYGSCVALPLFDRGGEPFGALALYAADAGAFDDREVALLEELAMDLAFGIDSLATRAKRAEAEDELRESYNRLETLTRDMVVSMGRIVEARDPYTQGHERRVAQLAKAIAERMGRSADQIAAVEMAALLHDIGKLGVPSEILTKPGALSRSEFALIKDHAQRGYEILKDISFPWPIADIVQQHHERMDGSGYPAHLKGDEILLDARILAVADVVEAMASHRPYRPAIGLAEAMAEIDAHAESYDAGVVAACRALYDEGLIQL